MTLDNGHKILFGISVILAAALCFTLYRGSEREKELEGMNEAGKQAYTNKVYELEDNFKDAQERIFRRDTIIARLTATLNNAPPTPPLKVFIHEKERAAFDSGLYYMQRVHSTEPDTTPLDPRSR